MDKETLSNYGWIVICVLVLAVMIALAGPFGNFVADAVKSTTQGLFDVNQSALNNTDLITIDSQNFDDVSNGTSTNDCPIVYGQPYQATSDDEIYEYVFYEDGSATLWMTVLTGEQAGLEQAQYLPAGSFTYTATEVICEGNPISISADGTTLTDPNDETFVMTLNRVVQGSVQRNVMYVCGVITEYEYGVKFGGEDGTMSTYRGGELAATSPIDTVQYEEHYLIIKIENSDDYVVCPIYPDGTKFLYNSLVFSISE